MYYYGSRNQWDAITFCSRAACIGDRSDTPLAREIWTRPRGVCCAASQYFSSSLTQGMSGRNTKIALKVKGQSQISPKFKPSFINLFISDQRLIFQLFADWHRSDTTNNICFTAAAPIMTKTSLKARIKYRPWPWRRPAPHYAVEYAWRQSGWLGRQDATLFHRAPWSYLCRRHVGSGTAECSCDPWTRPRVEASGRTTTNHKWRRQHVISDVITTTNHHNILRESTQTSAKVNPVQIRSPDLDDVRNFPGTSFS